MSQLPQFPAGQPTAVAAPLVQTPPLGTLTVGEEASPPTAPVGRGERIGSLDVLRGFALLGILLANIQDFASAGGILHDIPLEVATHTGSHPALDRLLMTGQWLFVEGRMRALFTVLFGASTVLLLERLERPGRPALAADIFHRRNLWLLLFGLIHGFLIWDGDILLYYSSMALLFLYPLRHVAARKLVCVGLATVLIGGTYGIANAVGGWQALPASALQEQARATTLAGGTPTAAEQAAVREAAQTRAEALATIPRRTAAARQPFAETFQENVAGESSFIGLVFKSGWILEIIGFLILGMGLFKTGFLSARLPAKTYFIVALVGYALSVPTVLVGLHRAGQLDFADAVAAKWLFIPYSFAQLTSMLATASVLLLLVRRGWLVAGQQGLAVVGRMAFSNYILTSLLCKFLFVWGPWKLYGTLEYYQQLYVVVAIWALNLAWSTLWLRAFAFGPLE